ncbi:MAG TPA: hypothetical protein VF576_00565 [Rubricoccaceae bacterium]
MSRPARLSAFVLLAGLAACDGGGGLVGTWEPVGGGPSRTTFFADGSARIVARDGAGPAEAYDARYAVAGDTALTLTHSDGQGAERFRLRVAPDTLVLESPETGMQTVLVRVRT